MNKPFFVLLTGLITLNACSPDTDPIPKIAESQREALDQANKAQAVDHIAKKKDEQTE